MVPLALLAQLAFFASGHQATLVSLQWKAAFVFTSKVSYLLSPLFVVLNTFGPTALIALAAPLVGIWNVALLAVMPNTSLSSSSGAGGGGRPTASAQESQPPTSQTRVAVLTAVGAALGCRCISVRAQRGVAAPPSHGLEGVRTSVYAWCR